MITVKEKAAVLITCKFFGDPKPDVIWKKYNGGNEDHIHEDTKTPFSNSTLFQVESDVRIDQTKKSDYGDYSCQAKNDYGTVVKNISLVVQCKFTGCILLWLCTKSLEELGSNSTFSLVRINTTSFYYPFPNVIVVNIWKKVTQNLAAPPCTTCLLTRHIH